MVVAMRRQWNVRVPMRDGTLLATDVYHAGAEGPGPTIVGRTPYNKNMAAFAGLAANWNKRGYTLVVQDVRGRGDSDGEFVPYVNEGNDAYDCIEWVAAQEWSDGDVIYQGASYGARCGWLTALTNPPHLRGFIATVSPSDKYVEFPNGTSPMSVSWHRLVDGRMMQNADAIDWWAVYDHLPLATMDEAAGFNAPNWKRAVAWPSQHDEGLDYQHRYGDIDLPVLHTSGWYDDEQIGTPKNFIGMRTGAASERARSFQRLLMGPWGHGVNASRKLGDVDFGPTAVIDLEGHFAAWADWVLGRAGTETEPPAAVAAPVRIFVMGTNVWRDEQEWPLARTQFTDFFLHSGGSANSRFGDGLLSEKPPEDEPADVYIYDPSRPVPFITAPKSAQIGGPDDYAAVEQRADVLCYTTDVLDADLEVVGPVRLVLHASSSAVDTDFTGKLVDVHPNGFCQRLCDSMVRARFREGHDREAFLEPGTVYEFGIDLWNTSVVFQAGHRIRLEVSSSAFPKYDRNLNTGEPIDTGVRMQPAENTVWHNATYQSRLVLPVIPTG